MRLVTDAKQYEEAKRKKKTGSKYLKHQSSSETKTDQTQHPDE